MNPPVVGILLAAGQGKRMNSSLPKVAHVLYGKPLIIWAINSLIAANVTQIIVVISPTQIAVENILKETSFPPGVNIKVAHQLEPLGTGHAAQSGVQAIPLLFSMETQVPSNLNILIAYGDTPAVQGNTFQTLLNQHTQEKNAFTILAFVAKNPTGYGRILTNHTNQFLAIREEKDCTSTEKQIQLCNSGFLCAKYEDLAHFLPLLQNHNAAKEFYLTDAPLLAQQHGKKVGIRQGVDESELLGINSQEQLAEMEQRFHIKYGVK